MQPTGPKGSASGLVPDIVAYLQKSSKVLALMDQDFFNGKLKNIIREQDNCTPRDPRKKYLMDYPDKNRATCKLDWEKWVSGVGDGIIQYHSIHHCFCFSGFFCFFYRITH